MALCSKSFSNFSGFRSLSPKPQSFFGMRLASSNKRYLTKKCQEYMEKPHAEAKRMRRKRIALLHCHLSIFLTSSWPLSTSVTSGSTRIFTTCLCTFRRLRPTRSAPTAPTAPASAKQPTPSVAPLGAECLELPGATGAEGPAAAAARRGTTKDCSSMLFWGTSVDGVLGSWGSRNPSVSNTKKCLLHEFHILPALASQAPPQPKELENLMLSCGERLGKSSWQGLLSKRLHLGLLC